MKTLLYEEHKKLGAKFVSFAGWDMPVWYDGIVPEHQQVRESAGLFDVSHMGEIFFTGEDAMKALNFLTCNDISKLRIGRAKYSAILDDDGGVVDDVIIYHLALNTYLVCVNASNREKDYDWFSQRNTYQNVEIIDKSEEYSLLAIQGPKAIAFLSELFTVDFNTELKRFSLKEYELFGTKIIIARTGYTGEDGLELFTPNEAVVSLWQKILEFSGQIKPIGLGARDSLRLEAGYPLHGHELSQEICALESGLSWIVKFQKDDFIGKAALEKFKSSDSQKRVLVSFELDGKGIARQDTKIVDKDSNVVGTVTSGTITPTINKAIGLALLDSNIANSDMDVYAELRGKQIPMKISEKPFYSLTK